MAASVLALVLTAACGQQTVLSTPNSSQGSSDGSSQTSPSTSPTTRAPRIGGTRPGALLRSRSIDMEPLTTQRRATAFQLDYLSQDLAGRPVRTTGTLLIPTGPPPAGGWPVVAYGRASSGILAPCAPSGSADLGGNLDVISPLVRLGHAVVLSDYQGMRVSRDGYQPYLVPGPGAADLTDLVVAARRLSPLLSRRWVAVGVADGGNAAWAANAAAARAPKSSRLQLLGTVSVSPLLGVSRLAALAGAGQLTTPQYPLMALLLQTLDQEVPGFDLDRFRSAKAKKLWPRLFQCGGLDAPAFNPVYGRLGATDLGPQSPKDVATLRSALALFSLKGPQWQPTAPMMVLYAGRDTTVRSTWVTQALTAVCARDATVTQNLDALSRRTSLDAGAVPAWIVDRFAGRRPIDDCGRLR